MIAKKSPIVLKDFAILNSELKFLAPQEQVDVQELFNKYRIDADYMIQEANGEFLIFSKVSINRNNQSLPGYVIFAESVATFVITDKEKIDPKELKAILNFTALNLALNNIRGHIVTMTSNSPMGKYLLPSIDLMHLVNEKSKKVKAVHEARNLAAKN